MKVIYQAENAIDANLLKGLLEQAGIQAYVHGQFLQGAIGELPASGLITVAVSDTDVDEGLRITEQFVADLKATNGKGETRWDPADQLLDWSG